MIQRICQDCGTIQTKPDPPKLLKRWEGRLKCDCGIFLHPKHIIHQHKRMSLMKCLSCKTLKVWVELSQLCLESSGNT